MEDRKASIPSDSSVRGSNSSFLAHLAPCDEFVKLLECPVCQNPPYPPIYTCQTGHIICIRCMPKLKECPLCNKPYTTSRNFALESIVLSSTFYCNNRDQGCESTGTVDVLNNHHDECNYRPIKCLLHRHDGCTADQIYLSEYEAHLQVHHRLIAVRCEVGKPNVFKRRYRCSDWGADSCKKDQLWTGSLITYDKKVFVTRTFNRGNNFYFKMVIVGEKSDEVKYAVKVILQKTNEEQFPRFELTTLVPSIREFQEKERSEDFMYGAVDKFLLERIGLLSVKPGTDSKPDLAWTVFYEIKVAAVLPSQCSTQ